MTVIKKSLWAGGVLVAVGVVVLAIVSEIERKSIVDFNNLAGFADPTEFTWREFPKKFSQPIAVPAAKDENYWLLVIEKGGKIIALPDKNKNDAIVLLDISDQITSGAGEQGLMDLEFDPAFETNRHVYISYTDREGTLVLATLEAADGVFVPETMERLLEVPQPHVDHNGGGLAFLPDGKLLLGLGDGGKKGGDPDGNAQNDESLLGKLVALSLESDETPSSDEGRVLSGSRMPAIIGKGLRNPWRFTYDPEYGGIFVTDVGQNAKEEVNFAPYNSNSVANFGWNYFEGSDRFRNGGPDKSGFTFPIVEYGHENGDCSVIGGEVYRGEDYPEWYGTYFYGDFCSGRIWGLKKVEGEWKSELLFDTEMWITSFGADNQGELYVSGFGGEIAYLTKLDTNDYFSNMWIVLKRHLRPIVRPILDRLK